MRILPAEATVLWQWSVVALFTQQVNIPDTYKIHTFNTLTKVNSGQLRSLGSSTAVLSQNPAKTESGAVDGKSSAKIFHAGE